MRSVWVVLLIMLASGSEAATYYIAPGGSNSNPGTQASPFQTLQKGHDVAIAGDTIIMRGGTYTLTSQTTLTRSGTSSARITVQNFTGETPVIDSVNLGGGTYPIRFNGSSWWRVKGLEVKNGAEGGIVISTSAGNSNNIIEQCNVHHNGALSNTGSGKGISAVGTGTNLQIINNDVHHNYNPINNGEDADGIQVFDPGNTGAVIRGNRVWNNSDDGIDIWNAPDVLVEKNWVWNNGKNDAGNQYAGGQGDGNCMKLGGSGTGDGGHTVRQNICWDQFASGYDQNSANRPSTFYNNTAWNNGSVNWLYSSGANIYKNNVSIGTLGSTAGTATFNSWNLGVTVNTADFQADDRATCALSARQADGSLPNCTFLKLVSGSDLIDVGTPVGIAFNGSAPDLGPYEFGGGGGDTTPPTVSISTPLTGATVAGSIAVSANATDNVGVVGVQFKLDGANLGTEDTVSPYSITWDTTTASEGSHALTAVARDANANSTTSATVSVTVDNVVGPPSGPVSYWLFDEVSGTTAFDSITANSNHLTLIGGASFVTGGQFGRALSLNGTNGYAEDTLTTNLNPTAAITIAGWLKPTSLPAAAFATIIIKSNGVAARGYGLNIFDGQLNFVKTGVANMQSAVTVPTGTWHHIAVTWDVGTGNALFYLDGVLSDTENNAGAITAPLDSDPVTIGKFPGQASFFNGLIDDLRVYNRVLTQPEIAALSSDTTPPSSVTVTAPANGAVVSGTITVSATAVDEIAIAGVQFQLDGAALGAEDTTFPYSISWNSNTTSSGAHALRALARDGGNNTTLSAAVNVTVNNVNVCQ